MLCIVTHTATTLRTGDHSLPRIDAQIFKQSDQDIVDYGRRGMSYVSVRVYMLMIANQ